MAKLVEEAEGGGGDWLFQGSRTVWTTVEIKVVGLHRSMMGDVGA